MREERLGMKLSMVLAGVLLVGGGIVDNFRLAAALKQSQDHLEQAEREGERAQKAERERTGAIPGSLHAPYIELQDNIDEGGLIHGLAASGRTIVFYCAFGERSAMAVQAAQDAGIKTACHISGGIDAWKKANGPLARQ